MSSNSSPVVKLNAQKRVEEPEITEKEHPMVTVPFDNATGTDIMTAVHAIYHAIGSYGHYMPAHCCKPCCNR